MYDKKHRVLYVGKAKDLKKRISSYFRGAKDAKTEILMSQVSNIEVVITPNENAALLLESNLIKLKKPHYNILMYRNFKVSLIGSKCKNWVKFFYNMKAFLGSHDFFANFSLNSHRK